MGYLAYLATVWVHGEERTLGLIGIEPLTKGDLTVRISRTAARAFLFRFLAATSAPSFSAGAQY